MATRIPDTQNSGPLVNDRTLASHPKSGATTRQDLADDPQRQAAKQGHTDTVRLSQTGKILGADTTAPAKGVTMTGAEAAQLAASLREAISTNGSQAILGHSNKDASDLGKLLQTKAP